MQSRSQFSQGPFALDLHVHLACVCSEPSLISSLRMGLVRFSGELTRRGPFPLTLAFPLQVIPPGSTCQHVGFWWMLVMLLVSVGLSCGFLSPRCAVVCGRAVEFGVFLSCVFSFCVCGS